VKQVLDLSKEVEESINNEYMDEKRSKKRKGRRVITSSQDNTTAESVVARKSRRVRRKINQVVSSDESEEDHAVTTTMMTDEVVMKPAPRAIAVRRSGRTCIPSKRSLLFSSTVDESDEVGSSAVLSSDDSSRSKSK
jgi:hypothetical protein